MTPKHVLATITAAQGAFIPISGKPKDYDLLHMKECLTLILLRILYNTVDVDHNLWGILSSDSVYKAHHNRVFMPPTRSGVYPKIP